MQNNIEIIDKKISNINISIDDDVKDEFELLVDSKSRIKEPIDGNDTTILLSLELNVNSKDEMINISINNDIIFELHKLYDEYEEIAEKYLIPKAIKDTSASLDKILIVMGYNKLNIAKNLK